MTQEPPREEPILITPQMLAGTDRTGRIDFERGMRRLPPLVLVLIALNLAMFAWELAAGALADRDTIIEAGALVRDRVLAGEWWRILSAMFLHGSVDHVLGNVIVLYIVGMACEHAFGGARTALVYLAHRHRLGHLGGVADPHGPGDPLHRQLRPSGRPRRWSPPRVGAGAAPPGNGGPVARAPG